MRLRAFSFEAIIRKSLTIGLAVSAITLFLVVEPHDALAKASLIGFATCHRIPERSLVIDGRQLPLCARCTGIYIGLLAGWTWLMLRRRLRATQLPSRPITVVLVAFIGLMGIDGLNSLAILAGLPHLYETQNWMRVFTGMLYGIAASLLLTPYVMVTLWREPSGDPSMENWVELLLLVNAGAALAMLALTEASFLLWPLVIVSVAGVLGLMGLMNVSIVSMLAGRVNVFAGWRDWLVPGLAGVALTLAELTAIAAMRAGAL